MNFIKVKTWKGKQVNKRYPVKLGLNVYIMFKEETGKDLEKEMADLDEIELIKLYRIMAVCGCRSQGTFFEFDDQFEFNDMIDENPHVIAQFSSIIVKDLEVKTAKLQEELKKMLQNQK